MRTRVWPIPRPTRTSSRQWKPTSAARGSHRHDQSGLPRHRRAVDPRQPSVASLGPTAAYEVIRRRAAQAGYTITQISQMGGHSLRAGFVTKAFRAGADAHQIMRQTGHRSHAVLETYAREHAPLVGNAVTRIGL